MHVLISSITWAIRAFSTSVSTNRTRHRTPCIWSPTAACVCFVKDRRRAYSSCLYCIIRTTLHPLCAVHRACNNVCTGIAVCKQNMHVVEASSEQHFTVCLYRKETVAHMKDKSSCGSSSCSSANMCTLQVSRLSSPWMPCPPICPGRSSLPLMSCAPSTQQVILTSPKPFFPLHALTSSSCSLSSSTAVKQCCLTHQHVPHWSHQHVSH